MWNCNPQYVICYKLAIGTCGLILVKTFEYKSISNPSAISKLTNRQYGIDSLNFPASSLQLTLI